MCSPIKNFSNQLNCIQTNNYLYLISEFDNVTNVHLLKVEISNKKQVKVSILSAFCHLMKLLAVIQVIADEILDRTL